MGSWTARTIVLAAVSAAGGCSIARHNTAVDARTELVGIDKNELYQCAGVPDRSAVVKGTEYATYHNEERLSQSLSIPLIGGGAASEQTQFCNTTATLVDGKVTSISYAGDTGAFYARHEQCAYSIGTCVAEIERQRKQSGAATGR